MFKCTNCGEAIDYVRVRVPAHATYTWHPERGTGPEAFGKFELDEGSEGDPLDDSGECPECGETIPGDYLTRFTLPEFTYTYTVKLRARHEGVADEVADMINRRIAHVEEVSGLDRDGYDVYDESIN